MGRPVARDSHGSARARPESAGLRWSSPFPQQVPACTACGRSLGPTASRSTNLSPGSSSRPAAETNVGWDSVPTRSGRSPNLRTKTPTPSGRDRSCGSRKTTSPGRPAPIPVRQRRLCDHVPGGGRESLDVVADAGRRPRSRAEPVREPAIPRSWARLGDEDWRDFSALNYLVQRSHLVFMPGMLIGEDAAAGPDELARQSALCRQYAEHFSDTPGLLYYLNGDYTLLRNPASPEVKRLWNVWLQQRYETPDKLRAAWPPVTRQE